MGNPVQQNAHMVSRQTVQVHRRAVASNCRSHARRACGPSNRRNRGHMLTSDSPVQEPLEILPLGLSKEQGIQR